MPGDRARRLGALAGQLGVERPPFYVRRPVPPALRRTFPAEGWYWVPRGHHTAIYLGASEVEASIELTSQIIDQENDLDATG